MPLRDHFHGMLRERYHWESLYSAWAYHVIRQANTVLPFRYHGALRTHLGASFNVGSPAQDIVEVCFHDGEGGPCLVAVVELVSPGNKDRLENRRAFAVKCAAYLQQSVSVIVVDIVTERHDNLHVQLMDLLERTGAAPWPAEQSLYAVAYRTTKENDAWRMDLWTEPLTVARPLPTLPLWLASNLAIPLDLEASYEETCQVLRIL
jgi:hypothetical protein